MLGIFDGDDTLWSTNNLYIEARRQFGELMAELGFNAEECIRQMVQLDVEEAKRTGFSKVRFAESLLHAYERIACRKVDDDPALKARLTGIGMMPLTTLPVVDPDAAEVLGCLKDKGIPISLYTAGDDAVQIRKVTELGLANYFELITVTKQKCDTELRGIARWYGVDPADCWVVGNSLRSDIAPAVEAGMKSVLIAGRGWEYDLAVNRRAEPTRVVDDLPSAMAVLLDAALSGSYTVQLR